MDYVISGWWQWKNMDVKKEHSIRVLCSLESVCRKSINHTKRSRPDWISYMLSFVTARKKSSTLFVTFEVGGRLVVLNRCMADLKRKMASEPTKNLFSFF